MSAVTAAIIGGAATVTAAGIGAYGANEAAGAQTDAANAQAGSARRNAMVGLQTQEPMRYAGYQALGDINNVFGYQSAPYASQSQLMTTLNPLTSKQVKQLIKGGASFDQIAQMGTIGTGDKSINRLTKAGYSPEQINQLRTGVQPQGMPQQGAQQVAQPQGMAGFQASPDYQFRLSEGQRDIGNSFAARGGAASGNALRALAEFNSGLASGEFNNWFQKRMQLVTGGQGAANNAATSSTGYTNSLMDSQQMAGDARASGITGMAGAAIGGLSGLATAYGNYANRNTGGYSGYGYGGGYQNANYGLGSPSQGSWDQLRYGLGG